MDEFLVVENLTHVYPPTRNQKEPGRALNSLTLSVGKGELFAILGPNGSGKTTLFRILSTLVGVTSGDVRIGDADLRTEPSRVRQMLGVVFQHPSLDKKLTIRENLTHQGHLHHLHGPHLDRRIVETLTLVGLIDRADELVEILSGGAQRRVELAKSLLHKPPLLLLDEPSTGLDPGARRDFIGYLEHLRTTEGVTILLTTHILDEADRCDRIAILDNGDLVALGSPGDLKREIGGDIITLTSKNAPALAEGIGRQLPGEIHTAGNTIRLERPLGHTLIPQLIETFPGWIEAVTLSKPTLEDVFIDKTGHGFSEDPTAQGGSQS